MYRMLKLFHLGGLVLFLGSILTFVVISVLIEGAVLEQVAFGRAVISAGTYALTLPGLWLLAITGLWMGLLRYGSQRRFFQLKLVLTALVAVNAHFVVVPAVTAATELAMNSLPEGRLLKGYQAAYLQETIFGAVNLLLAVALAAIGVWRSGGRAREEYL